MEEDHIEEEALFSNDPASELFPSLLERMLLIYAALVADSEEEEILNKISDTFETDFHEAETQLLDFEQKIIDHYYRQANIAELEFFPDEDPATAEVKHRLAIKKIVAYFSYEDEPGELAEALSSIDTEAKQLLDTLQSDPEEGMEKVDLLLSLWEVQALQSLYPDLFDEDLDEHSEDH
ncbi:MAG TPA: hypothetical protein DEA96_01455 [Leptospiraceae bacterium]|nr:hypothetical protein [Spirochaetaceae bacterium]HBS03601.1 hypothetical protein [Leptospiraceae bacterium]|tara:strand:- start:37792 stop:38328 length:537 start_codon:yes stop_codon:yes gene_type:complete